MHFCGCNLSALPVDIRGGPRGRPLRSLPDSFCNGPGPLQFWSVSLSDEQRVETIGGQGWGPRVYRDGDALMYHFPVESSFVSHSFSFEISHDHLHVLQTNRERFYLLYAALHHPHQLPPRPDEAERRAYADTILLGDEETVATFLDAKNEEANGAVTSLLRQYFESEESRPQQGSWFPSA